MARMTISSGVGVNPEIRYGSNNPARRVLFTPRTAETQPRMVAAAINPAGAARIGGRALGLSEISGVDADVYASVWDAWSRGRKIVHQYRGTNWAPWSLGELMGYPEDMSPFGEDEVLLKSLRIKKQERLDLGAPGLHPVPQAAYDFMVARSLLTECNALEDSRALLPEAAFLSPILVVGMMALDDYRQK